MSQDKLIGNTKRPYLLVDSSYVSFHRFFSTLIWYTNIHPDEEVEDDYDWSLNQEFMKHFDDTYMKNLLKFKNMYNIPYENMIIVRDCPRETIWRMNIYPEYKANRKNTCSYKNKKYNIGNIFKHIYNVLYPKLEKQYAFKIVKIDNAEADDVIAVLANRIRDIDKTRLVVIISNDNDYLQLVNEKTLIWSLQGKLLNTKVESTAEEILLRKILKGDESDNIPSLVGNIGEKEFNDIVRDSRKLSEWFNKNPEKYDLYLNNRRLIDFRYIPEELKNLILNECKVIFPEVELEKKKEEIKICVEQVKKIKPEVIENRVGINLPKFKPLPVPKQFNSPYVNYKNYGNPFYNQYTPNYLNRYPSNYINFATEDYYFY